MKMMDYDDFISPVKEFNLTQGYLTRDMSLKLNRYTDVGMSIGHVLGSFYKDGYNLIPKDVLLHISEIAMLRVVEDSTNEIVKFEIEKRYSDENIVKELMVPILYPAVLA